MDDPTAPHSIEAEAATLGAILLDAPRALPLARAATVAEDDFYRPAHRAIWHAVTELHQADRPIDEITVLVELERAGILTDIGGAPFLHTLLSVVPTVANVVTYARIVVQLGRRRRLIDLGHRIRQLGLDEADPERLAAAAAVLVAQITDEAAGTDRDDRRTDGATFCLDTSMTVTSIWGDGADVAWAEGESLMLVGPQGVGKTTLAGQLTLARIGLRKDLLGMPVVPTASRVLYLACDRPRQIRRSFRRMVDEADRDTLAERLIVWQGPPLADLARQPNLLADLARDAGADTVVIDSLKDVAIDLVKDEAGAGYNRARQLALVGGIQLVELHHQRKSGTDGRKPKSLSDVYGSVWLTAGAGSVLLLWGDPGDPVVELVHLKQPAEELGPMKLLHDAQNGTTIVVRGADTLDLVRAKPGLTAADAAHLLFDIEGRSPEPKEIEKARRKLDALVRKGLVHRRDGAAGGATKQPATYYAVSLTEPP